MERIYGVGIHDFEKLRERNAVYVDKTALIYRMVTSGDYYFLSRPRRFGKSLLVSTLAAYFEGRKDLFKGLAIDHLETEWMQYPVIRVDFSRDAYRSINDLDGVLNSILSEYESIYGKNPEEQTPSRRFDGIIRRACKQTGKKVVVLIDEYDAPMMDALDNPQLLEQIREEMRAFYKPIKSNGENLRFVLLTGITKFSQMSIFSALNNLNDISMDDRYATVCGISEEELYSQMLPDIRLLGENLNLTENEAKAELKRYYDGYHFSKKSPDMYNPFSLILAFDKRDISDFWFQSGTPTFLVKLFRRYKFEPYQLENITREASDFDTSAEQIESAIPLLYQSGYLTIKGYQRGLYKLEIPNEEVRTGMYKSLMNLYVPGESDVKNVFMQRLGEALQQNNIELFMRLIRAFMASIPYDAEKQDENHYKTIFYLIFRLLTSYTVRTEERSSAGRCDALVETDQSIYIFEFKIPRTQNPFDLLEIAMEQIDQKGYAIPYEVGAKKVYKIAATFDDEKRTIGTWTILCS